MMESNVIKLEGTVEDVVFRAKDGYIVFELATTEDELVTVVGDLGDVRNGEKVTVHGNYINHAKFGTQFKANYFERQLPTTNEGIEKYLASGVIKGIGKSTAKRLIEAFGSRTLDVIENHPERLAQVKGISKSKAMEISRDFRKIFHIKKVFEFLMPFHVSASTVIKAFRKWELDTIEQIKSNPYVLCSEGVDLPFEEADKIAYSFGFERNCYERVSAGFCEVLNTAGNDGHTCLPMGKFLNMAQDMLNVSLDDVCNYYETACADGTIVLWNRMFQDDLREQYVYLKSYYDAETFIASRVCAMTEMESSILELPPEVFANLEKHTGVFYNEKQKEAIEMAVSTNFMLLTGGPGTGKTTTLTGIITMLELQGLKVKVTAPTGRASKRITELTGHDAMTIHRLLEVKYGEDGTAVFLHNASNPIKCDAIVVDEMSMVDTLLFKRLLEALRYDCKVILVGDSDQLPSVSAGNVLKDLIASDELNVVVLDEIFRQAQKSAIVMNAHKVIRGEYPNIYLKDNDFFFFQRLDYKSAQDTIIDLWCNRLPKAYEYSPIHDIQVLCPSRKGTLGTIALNQLMQNYINPKKPNQREAKNGIYTFRVGDKVMQIKNNYDVSWEKDAESGNGIYNGDMGIIKEISKYTVKVDFDGRIISYDSVMLSQLELAYAVTIHKSQGSEFNVVVMPMLNNFKMLSYRNLLYTGITRAKKLLVIVGSTKELFSMVDNDKQALRYSRLKSMIQEEFGDVADED